MALEIKEILLRLPWKTFDLVDYFYVPGYTYYYWHSFWLELMILNIFQIYFKMSSQKVEVWIFLWYFLIHEDFKFLILTVSFQRNLFKFCIMRVIVGTKMCFYFQKIVPVNTPFIGWNWCLQLWIFHSKWLMQICNLCYDVIKKIWPFFILSFLI